MSRTRLAESTNLNGGDPKRFTPKRLGASRILDILGPDWFVEIPAVKAPGKVIWCNFELAHALGFDVPRSNRMTPEFHEQLIDVLSYRALQPDESPDESMNGFDSLRARDTITLYADKYGGEGVAPALGAGRAGFLPYGNLCVKGIGLTPLFKSDDPDDFTHSHGGLTLKESLAEAIFGEVNSHFLGKDSARVLAIIDHGQYVVSPRKERVRVVLLARASAQLRPAHILADVKGKRARLEAFIRMTAATGQLVTRRNRAKTDEIVDIRATFLRVVDDLAKTSAELFRWRMIHGALSASNMEMGGAMLDVSMQSAQPRTAPIWVISDIDSIFGEEHVSRAVLLRPVYRALINSVPMTQRRRFNAGPINLRREMEKRYHCHLQTQLLCAIGVGREMAERIRCENGEAVKRFAEIATEMMKLRNPGCVDAGSTVGERVSVMDVFRVFQTLPGAYFENPEADHSDYIRAAADPIYRGNRFHITKRKARAESLIKMLDRAYCEVMRACESYAEQYYGDLSNMRLSVVARAAFENEPLNLLYYAELSDRLAEAIAEYDSTADAEMLERVIDEKIRRSSRSVEMLLIQGSSRRSPDGGYEIEKRTIDGIVYSLKAWDDPGQPSKLCVRVPIEDPTNSYIYGLTSEQVRLLRYRFRINAWTSPQDVGSRLTRDSDGSLVIEFDDICNLPPVGRLDGQFIVAKSNGQPEQRSQVFGGYTFAVPNLQELLRLAASLR